MYKDLINIIQSIKKTMWYMGLNSHLMLIYVFNALNLLIVILVTNFEKKFVDDVLEKQNYRLLGIVVLVLLVGSTITYFANCVIIKYKSRVNVRWTEKLKNELVGHIFTIPMLSIKEKNNDDLKMRIDTDADIIVQLYDSIYIRGIPAVVSLLLYVVLIIRVSLWLSIVILGGSLLFNFLGLGISKSMDKDNLIIREKTNDVNQSIYMNLTNYEAFKIRNMQEHSYCFFANDQKKIRDANFFWMFSYIKLIVFQMIKTEFFQNVFIYLISAIGVISGIFSVGSVVLLLSYFTLVNKLLADITNIIIDNSGNKNSYDRCVKMLEEVPKLQRSELVEEPIIISINNLKFAYTKDFEVLGGINLKIAPCSKNVLIGSSGQGKSTLIKCLAKMEHPDAGNITMNGIDIQKISDYYNIVSITLQDAALFNMSVWDNLTLGNESLTQDNVEFVCDIVNIKDDIAKLDDGIDTKIGVNGTKLSGGQRQKLIMARALLKNASVIIFDEAGSALDIESEKQINNYLLEQADKTVIVISHRTSTTDLYANKYLLEDGKVIEI